MGRLRILTAGIEPAVLEIPADVVTLGRREDNVLCVPHASVSGRHCELGESDDSLTILDLGSTNGTFIKGQRIEQGTVAAGETFQLGAVEIRYEVGAAVEAPVAPKSEAPRPAPAPSPATAPAPAAEVAPAPSAPAAAVAASESETVVTAAPAPAPVAEKPKGVFPPMPPQPKPGAPLMPKPPAAGGAASAAPQAGAATGVKPPLQKSAASLLPTDNPAVKPPAQPLVGSGPKVIAPPSAPPKFSLGHHAKPPAAPAPSATPESGPLSAAAAAPEAAHGGAATPAAPKPPQPAQPLGGGGPKIIVPPSAPPKFSLGGHAKPHAAPAVSPKPEGTPSPEAAAASAPAHGAAAAPVAPAAPKPAVPLGGGGPKVIVPPSGPPKFSLGGHAKPHAAPPASPKPEGAPTPEAAATPAPEHGAAAAPVAPAAPKPAVPLGGGGPKVIVPPSGPPKFSLGSHAKPHAAPAASGAAPAPPVAPAPPAAPAVEAEPIAELPAEATPEDATEPTTEAAPDSATETATETAAESAGESPSEVPVDPAPDAPTPDPPAPVAATAAPTAAVSQSAPAKNENRCARHPANVAQHICPKCRAYACDTCGSLSAARGKPKIFCPVCGAKTQPLAEFEKVQAARQAREDLSFHQQVKGVFKYPFGKGGLALLIIGSLMFFGLDVLVTWGWKFRFIMLKAVSSVGILALFSAGYLCAYLQKILFATAQGEDEVPGWPDFTNWKDDIVMPFRLAIAAFVASFGPAFGYLIFHAVNNSEMRLPVLFPLFALGLLYFPMALLAVAISNNWLAVNPLVVMPAIARLNLQYVLACVVFFGMVLARFVSESLLHVVLPIPVLPGLISSFIALYFLCVEMRLLGLLYFTNKKRLGWFST